MMVPTTTKTTTTTTTTTMTTMTTTRTTTTATTTNEQEREGEGGPEATTTTTTTTTTTMTMTTTKMQLAACHVRKFRWNPPLSFPPPTPTGIAGVRSSTIRLRRLHTSGLPYERPRATRALWWGAPQAADPPTPGPEKHQTSFRRVGESFLAGIRVAHKRLQEHNPAPPRFEGT